MMLVPLRWPSWPWLPLKRYVRDHGAPEVAMMYAGDTTPNCKVRLWTGYPRASVTKTYDNVDALLADGWVVD